MRDERVVIRKSLQTFALSWSQSPDRGVPVDGEQRSCIAPARTAGLRLERRHDVRWTAPAISRNATLETNGNLPTRVRMAIIEFHGAECWR